jgi:hypothetical protein
MVETAEERISEQQSGTETSTIDVPVPASVPSLDQPAAAPPQRRERAGAAAPRRTRVSIRHVGLLSVLKVSLLFYLCAMLVIWLALLMIFLVLEAGGVLDTVAEWAGCVVNGREGTRGCVPVEINGRAIFSWLLVAAGVFTLILALINMFVALIYNLISDLVGGLDVTLAERRRR